MATFNVNGQMREAQPDPGTPLLWVLRQELKITGPKFGCGMALCGACTVLIDGQATRSCVTPIEAVGTRRVVSIEGLEALHPKVAKAVKAAWIDLDVAQCGYCQPGQITAATALLAANPKPSDAQIDEALSGNICRCGTYPRIRAAVHRAAGQLAA